MPPPLLFTLGKRASAAFPIIQRGVREGISANSIQTILRASGMGIRRQTLLDIVRAERNIISAGKNLQNIRLGFVPDPRRLPEALTKISRSFNFVVRITGTDTSTGSTFIQNISVALDKPLTRSRLEAIAVDFIEAEKDRYGINIEEVLLIEGVKAGPLGTRLPILA